MWIITGEHNDLFAKTLKLEVFVELREVLAPKQSVASVGGKIPFGPNIMIWKEIGEIFCLKV